MTVKTVNLVYFSPTNTTQKVIKAIGEGTDLPVREYNFTFLKDNPVPPQFGKEDLVVVGAPVYVGRVPPILLNYLKGLRGDNAPCVLVGVYGNRHFDDYLVELEDLVREGGFLPVAAAVFLGQHSFTNKLATDRPNQLDLQIAKDFGSQIAAKTQKNIADTALQEGQIPGDRPYRDPYNHGAKQTPYCPVVKDHCTDCKACIKACPTGAISRKNQREIDSNRCIKCRACVKSCPVQAIEMEQKSFWEHTVYLEETYSAYKPVITIL